MIRRVPKNTHLLPGDEHLGDDGTSIRRPGPCDKPRRFLKFLVIGCIFIALRVEFFCPEQLTESDLRWLMKHKRTC